MKRLVLLLTILSNDDAELDRRVTALSQQLRCLVCQNETLADSRAELAVDLRKEIREQMISGRSDREVIAFLTERYGDFVLYRPPLKPATYLLWFGPFLLLAGGTFALYRSLKQRQTLIEHQALPAAERKRAERLLSGNGKEANLAVYRDHFAEMESDLRAGIVDKEQFERDREELERRLLEDLSAESRAGKTATPARGSFKVVYALSIGLPLAAVLLYLKLGSPDMLSEKPNADSLKALALAGNAAFEAGDYGQAVVYWERLQRSIPPDSEPAQYLQRRIREARALANGVER